MKKLIAVLTALIFIISVIPAFADGETVYTLSLKDAINMALKDNGQLAVLKAVQYSNSVNADAAKLNRIASKNYMVPASSYELMYVKKGYYEDLYKSLMRLNKLETKQATQKITYNVTESYYNYKIAASLCELTENAYNLALENLEAVNERYKLGMIAKIDADNAAISVESVKNTLESYKRNLMIAKENLKIQLQIEDENCDFVLKDPIVTEEINPDFEKDLSYAMENRYDVNALKENYELSKLYLDYSKSLTPSSAAYQSAYSDFLNKEYTFNNNKKLIALSLKSTYFNMLNAYDSLKVAEKTAAIAKQRYDISKVKHENGMITNTEFTQSLNDYLKENINLENAKLKYKMATEKYSSEISIGL